MHKQVRINTNTSAGRALSKDALERAPCQLNVTDMFSTEKGEKKGEKSAPVPPTAAHGRPSPLASGDCDRAGVQSPYEPA